jgi:hypothetical protein
MLLLTQKGPSIGVPLLNRTAPPPELDAASQAAFTNLEVRSQGFYDDIVRARGELANRSGIDQQLTY